MSIIRVNGRGLFCEQKGDGVSIVFVHGTMSDYRVWRSQTDQLSRTYRTVAYSRRSAFPNVRPGDLADSSVENDTDDLGRLIDELGVSPSHLVGHSYGGFIAAYFAAQHPEMLRSLTLVNAAIVPMLVRNPNNPVAMLSFLIKSSATASSGWRLSRASRTSIKEAEAGNRDGAARLFYASLWDKGTAIPQPMEEDLKMMADNARNLNETTKPFPEFTVDEAKEIRTPTLVIRGEQSALWDLKISERLASAIKGSDSARVSNAGHFCMVENPSEFNGRLLQFLAAHS